MGNYSVPDSIRKFKPKGTMVKRIKNNFYVYEYSCAKNDAGKWVTKMGGMIGTIKEDVGFIPNDSFNKKQSNTTLEYGQYALAVANSKMTLEKLLKFFNPLDAYQIYFMAICHFVNGFTYLKNIETYIEQSYLSIKYPSVKLSYTALSSLLDSLGRNQANVDLFQQELINESSKDIAIDGHVIRSCSHENDLAELGNKFNSLKDAQLNVLMAYDIHTNKPLLSRMFEGGNLDKISIKEIIERFQLNDVLFIVDRGFYSESNIQLFSSGDNKYIVPLSQNLTNYKRATENMKLNKVFTYERKRKRSTIEYKEIIDNDKQIRMIVFRDLNQSAIDSDNYLKNISINSEKYTEEGYQKVKDFFGVIVLQTNCLDKSAKDIFELYKKRWKIETYFDYFKNRADISALHMPDYYKSEGLAFIMLIVGLIHSEFSEAMKNVKGLTIDDVLLEGRFVKIHKGTKLWRLENIKKSRQDMMTTLNVDFSDVDSLK